MLIVAIAAMSILGSTNIVNAQEIDMLTVETLKPEVKEVKVPEPVIIPPLELPKPVEYIVVKGDNLTKIALATNSTVARLWSKNTGLSDPDVIDVGDKLIVPLEGEALAERPLPHVEAPLSNISTNGVSKATYVPRGSSSGNTYYYRQCVWYAKERRPDLPNNLGNANTWFARAAAQGIPTGSTPRPGAIGQKGMHVVYIEAVNNDGTVYLSEMNYDYKGGFRYRTAAASDFLYIY